MDITIRQLIATRLRRIILLAVFASGPIQAELIPEAGNLQESAKSSENKVFIIIFSSDRCPFCIEMKDLYLEPMLTDPNYKDKVIIREVETGNHSPLTDFEGHKTLQSSYASRFGVYLTPTLVFLDKSGREMTEKIIGLGDENYFSYYLDEAINAALEKIRE